MCVTVMFGIETTKRAMTLKIMAVTSHQRPVTPTFHTSDCVYGQTDRWMLNKLIPVYALKLCCGGY